MFERFNEKAVKVIMIAREESRRLGHNYIGTEQILLGLIGERTGIAAGVLASMGITLEKARTEVERFIGQGEGVVSVEIPFTPRAKAAVEMALEVSSELKHGYIGTEHVLLAIVREGERILNLMGRGASHSLAFRVLQNLGADPFTIQAQVMQILQNTHQTQGELFSLQPYRERLRILLPPMSSQAVKVWHAISSQTGWEETDVAINPIWLKWVTKLSESEVQAALDELTRLEVIRSSETT